jgi:purine-cytosine permease-like protein
MAIIFAIMLIIAAPKMAILPLPTVDLAWFAGFVSFGGAIYGFATGWSSYAADYHVNQPKNTSAGRIFWLTFLGVTVPCIALELLGVAFTTVSAYQNKGGGDLLAAVVQPLGGFRTFLLVLLALSVIANNIPNDYSLGLSMQVLGHSFQRVNRAVWTFIGAVAYVIIAIIGAPNFNVTLENFLLLIAYWLGPWAIILVLEHFVFRRGKYNVEDWNTPGSLPPGAALVSLTIGLVGVYLGASQYLFTGPVSKALGGMDVGFELGIVLAAIAYLVLRRVELNVSKR